MATALICDMCESEQADVIVTNLGNGDTMAVGQQCLPALGQQFMAMGPDVEGMPPIEADGTGWPGDVDLSDMPPGMDATMAKAWKEAEAEALAQLQAEAAAEAAQGVSEPSDGADGAVTPPEGAQAVHEALNAPESTV